MDHQTLSRDVCYLKSSGIILSTELQALLSNSLCILQDEEKLQNVQFWGRIRATLGCYYVAKGFSGDYCGVKRFFYSTDAVKWGLLNPPSAELSRTCTHTSKHPFTGDASFILECSVFVAAHDEDGTAQEIQISLKEEDRLSDTIHTIDKDACIVPRGALVARDGKVVRNRLFEGLSEQEASFHRNFMYMEGRLRKVEVWRRGKEGKRRPDFEACIDFMKSLDEDVPKRSWTLQIEDGVVVLRSLKWLGAVFYHLLNCKQHGWCYSGDGRLNKDLPFML